LTQRVLATADWNDAEVDKREALLMEKAMNVFTATVK
jgi:hypothetical protein